MRHEGLKVERCTLNVGQQRGGAPRSCAGTGGGADRARGATHRGRFFGKPLRAISRFSHQGAQTPPSPLVGEGGWGDEG